MTDKTLAERQEMAATVEAIAGVLDGLGKREMAVKLFAAADALDAKDAEIAQWQRVIWDNRCAFVAMRNDLNELFGDMVSDEATLRKGPEMSHECAAIVEAARKAAEVRDAEIARLREVVSAAYSEGAIDFGGFCIGIAQKAHARFPATDAARWRDSAEEWAEDQADF